MKWSILLLVFQVIAADGPRYLSDAEKETFMSEQVFEFSPEDKITFYRANVDLPLGLGVLVSPMVQHMTMLVTSAKDPSKSLSIGFYPEGGNIMGALAKSKPGVLFAPDPWFSDRQGGFHQVSDYSDEYVETQLGTQNADDLNRYFSNLDGIRLRNGANSSARSKRNRLEVPTDLRYSVIKNNCINFVYDRVDQEVKEGLQVRPRTIAEYLQN